LVVSEVENNPKRVTKSLLAGILAKTVRFQRLRGGTADIGDTFG
jgi:hypothetical protein